MVYQVSGNSVRRNDVDGAADGAVAPVGGEDHDRRDAGLQRSVKIREALRVKKEAHLDTLSEALQWRKKYIRAGNVKQCSDRYVKHCGCRKEALGYRTRQKISENCVIKIRVHLYKSH